VSESEGRYQRWGSGGLIGYRAWPPPSATQHHSDGEATPHPAETGGWSWSSMTQRRTVRSNKTCPGATGCSASLHGVNDG